MKDFFIKISTFSLAILVLFSTFSFTVEKHYCGDFLVDVSFNGENEGCGMQMKKSSAVKKKNCCKDETHHVVGQDELQLKAFEKISFEKQQFITAFVFSYQNLFVDENTDTSFQNIFPPPEIYQNYQITYQTFLI